MDNYHIFIASCFEGLNTQLPRLVKNILDCNIPTEFVHFIVGGCPIDQINYNNGIEIVHVTYRCFEFTPHIYIINNPNKYNFDFAFFTHDTVKFGNHFYETIKNDIIFLKNTQFETMRIENSYPSMNIGVYSKKSILNNYSTLASLRLDTNDHDKLFKTKNDLVSYEDFIFKQGTYNNGDISEFIPKEQTSINGTKSNGSIRKFNRIDFIKYQSNANSIQTVDICKIED